MSHALYVALVALVALQRLAELRRSRRHLAAAAADGRVPPREPAYAAMVAVHTAALVGAPLEVLACGRAFVPAVGVLALVLLALAQLGRVWVLRTLGLAWSTQVVKPAAVVTGGPYRFVRHPNYLVVCVELVALPLVHGAWLTAVVTSAANALVLARRIPREEAVLAKDPAWVRAFARVPRLLPVGRRRG